MLALAEREPGLVELIARLSITPVVERPVRVLRVPRYRLGDDDFVTMTHAAAASEEANAGGLTRYVCAISIGGELVLRVRLRSAALFSYTTPELPPSAEEGEQQQQRVRFTIVLPPPSPVHPRMAIMELVHRPPECYYDRQKRPAVRLDRYPARLATIMAMPTTEIMQSQYFLPEDTEEAVLAFRAKNALGVELRLSTCPVNDDATTTGGPWTPVLVAHA